MLELMSDIIFASDVALVGFAAGFEVRQAGLRRWAGLRRSGMPTRPARFKLPGRHRPGLYFAGRSSLLRWSANSLEDALVIFDERVRPVFANHAALRLFGITRVKDCTARSFRCGDAAIYPGVQRVLRTGASLLGHQRSMTDACGRQVEIIADIAPLRRGEAIRGAVCLARVADGLTAGRGMSQAQIQLIDRLTSRLAHDYNNLLTVILGSLSLAREELALERPEVMELLDSAQAAALEARELTQRLRGLHRPLSFGGADCVDSLSLRADGASVRGDCPDEAVPLVRALGEEPCRGAASFAGEARATGGLRILLMDDELGVRRVAARILRGLGHEVVTAADGGQAVRELLGSEQPFDFAILDLTVVGGMGGIEAGQMLKSLQPSLPVLISTANAGGDDIANFSPYGFNGVLPKPYSAQELREGLARAMQHPCGV